MVVGILQDIIEKIREVSVSGNSLQVTDEKIIKYINSYYLYDMPNDLRNIKLEDTYTLNTIQGVDTYPFDYEHWSTLKAPSYCSKINIPFFQNRTTFYGYNFNSQQQETFANGDGTVGVYVGTAQATPIIKSVANNPMVSTLQTSTSPFPSGYPPQFNENTIGRIQNILISANTANGSVRVTDDGSGALIGDCAVGSSINYESGDISVTFNQVIPGGNPITIQYIQSVQGQPFSILFYQNQIILRPVPDQSYTIEITGMRQPSQVLLGTSSTTSPNLEGRPEELFWWELIAFGVAKKLYQDRLDTDGVQMMDVYLQEKIDEARTRTYAQLGSRSITTMFRDEATNNNSLGWLTW